METTVVSWGVHTQCIAGAEANNEECSVFHAVLRCYLPCVGGASLSTDSDTEPAALSSPQISEFLVAVLTDLDLLEFVLSVVGFDDAGFVCRLRFNSLQHGSPVKTHAHPGTN